MSELIRIAHSLYVYVCRAVLRHIDTIRNTERPRQIKLHISVLVQSARILLLVFLSATTLQLTVVLVVVLVFAFGSFLFLLVFLFLLGLGLGIKAHAVILYGNNKVAAFLSCRYGQEPTVNLFGNTVFD